jgi:hypothetical protein
MNALEDIGVAPSRAENGDGWVLAAKVSGKWRYHLEDYPIGPASVSDIEKAYVFPTREAACQSAGFRHWSSNLLPMTLADARSASLSPQPGDS